MLRVWSVVATGALLLFSWSQSRSLAPVRDLGVLPIDPPTPFFHIKPPGQPQGKVLVVHGLDANKDFMQVFCAALADGGFDVYAIDLPGHGDSPVGFTATRAKDAVARTLDWLGNVDVVIGHSLGAGLLLDIANDRAFPRMVLLSPAPTAIGHINLSRTLVVTGTLDIPAINTFVPQLEGAAVWRVPWSFHSSAPFDPNTTRNIVSWLGGASSNVHSSARLWWNLLSVASAVALGICLLPKPRAAVVQSKLRISDIGALFVLAGTGAAIIAKLLPVMRWLHLFATDYLVGMILVIGLILWGTRPKRLEAESHAASFLGILAAAYMIIIVGLLAATHLAHFSLHGGRWWRFAVIAISSFPLFYFDEAVLRPASWLKAGTVGVLTRSLLGVSVMMGALTLSRGNAFIVLIAHMVIIFWIVLWLLTGVVNRHTGSPIAAALFACLVQGWMFAAWFVIT